MDVIVGRRIPPFSLLVVPLLAGLLALTTAGALLAQTTVAASPWADLDGEALYDAACASCHGADGAGQPPSRVAFEEPLPDFTNCNFATREPDADWVAVAHQGGPARGFSPMMPAFGEALSPEQLQLVMDYVRSFCGAEWPRGELNLPRALMTEKAYPEDEAVLTTSASLEGAGAIMNKAVYEKRFGTRSQFEVVVPFGWQNLAGEDAPSPHWVGGVGDVVVGAKRDVFHSLEKGSIVAVAGEIKLPTGDRTRGFGGGTTVLESFVSYGQLLPSDAFFQFQGIVEVPTDREHADELLWRAALGRTFATGLHGFGRAWSPMVEVLGWKELEDEASVHWDLVPQLQFTLNTRQHVMANVGVRLPLDAPETRDTQLVVYVLWDWFDGGFFAAW